MREKREPTGGKHLWTPTHQQSANAPFLARALEPRMSDGYCVKPGPAGCGDNTSYLYTEALPKANVSS